MYLSKHSCVRYENLFSLFCFVCFLYVINKTPKAMGTDHATPCARGNYTNM